MQEGLRCAAAAVLTEADCCLLLLVAHPAHNVAALLGDVVCLLHQTVAIERRQQANK